MESNRRAGAKSLRAVGRQPVNNKKTALTHLEGEQQQSLEKRRNKRVIRGVNPNNDRLSTRMVPCDPYPPAFDAERIFTQRMRYVSAEAADLSSATFSLAQGHNQFLVVTATSTNDTGVCYVDEWRIKRIDVWCIDSDENATGCAIRPHLTDIDTNSFNDREAEYYCSSRSGAKPGSMSIVPAKDTPLGGWHKTSTVNSSGTLFYFEADYGSASSGNYASITMDIVFEFVLNLAGAPNGYTRTTLSTGHTLGTLGGCNLFGGGMLLQAINVLV